MADHAPLRTGRLVVRYHAPWRRRAIAIGSAIGLVLLLFGTFEYGRYRSGYSKYTELQHRRELSATIDRLEKENEQLRQAVSRLQKRSDVLEAYRSVSQ